MDEHLLRDVALMGQCVKLRGECTCESGNLFSGTMGMVVSLVLRTTKENTTSAPLKAWVKPKETEKRNIPISASAIVAEATAPGRAPGHGENTGCEI